MPHPDSTWTLPIGVTRPNLEDFYSISNTTFMLSRNSNNKNFQFFHKLLK